jgi:quinol monooxygenase YgiN
MSISNQIWVIVELTIESGKSEDFKKLAQQFIDRVNKNEPDALKYEWHLNNDETVCSVMECYASSDAVLAHLEDIGDLMPSLMDIAKFTRVEVYGNPSQAVTDAVAPLGAIHYSAFGGISR